MLTDSLKSHTTPDNEYTPIPSPPGVPGLGNIGALAGKPVMEGKAVLFKKFAGIDVFDIEVDAAEPDRFVDVVAALEPSFGAINLEDIKAPECFIIEQTLRERMNIPVFHDDQHGTAIITAAGLINACLLTNRRMDEIKVVVVVGVELSWRSWMPLAAVDVGGGGSEKRCWTRVGVVAGGGYALAATGIVVDVAVDGEGDGDRVVVVKESVTGVVDALGSLEDEGLDGLEETALAV